MNLTDRNEIKEYCDAEVRAMWCTLKKYGDNIENLNTWVNNICQCRVVGSSISGIAKHANYQGTFFLDLKKN